VLADDGVQAIGVAKLERPDVAILDVQMPKKSGLEAAEELHEIAPELPLILYTANDDMCICDRRTEYVSACVDKNTGFTDLFLSVCRVLMPAGQNDCFRIGLAPRSKVLGAAIANS
jgi:CheY-like chemotaxis protein